MRWSIQGALLLVVAVVSSAQPCRGPNCTAIDVETITTSVCWGVSSISCCYRVEVTRFHCPIERIGGYYFNRVCHASVPGCGDTVACVTNPSFTLEELIGAIRMTLFSYDPYGWFNVYDVVRVIHPSCWVVDAVSGCLVGCGDTYCCYVEGTRGNPGPRQNTTTPVQCPPSCTNVCP
jgi:hypothetical protein